MNWWIKADGNVNYKADLYYSFLYLSNTYFQSRNFHGQKLSRFSRLWPIFAIILPGKKLNLKNAKFFFTKNKVFCSFMLCLLNLSEFLSTKKSKFYMNSQKFYSWNFCQKQNSRNLNSLNLSQLFDFAKVSARKSIS